MNLTWPCGTPRSTNNAFSVLYETRTDTPKNNKRRKPKRTHKEWALIGLESPTERALRQIKERAIRVNKHSDTGRSTGPTNSEIAPR